MNKKVIIAITIVMVLLLSVTPYVLAANQNGPISSSLPNSGNAKVEKVYNAVSGVWGSVVLIVRILAFSAIIFAGVRYMFASSEDRADIKKSLIILVIGAIFVFGATTVVDIVRNIAQQAL